MTQKKSRQDQIIYFQITWALQKSLNQLSINLSESKYLHENKLRDFPGGPVVKNPPSDAWDLSSVPGQRTKIPHAVGQLRPCATATEAEL